MRAIEGAGYGQAAWNINRLLERRALPAGVAAWPGAVSSDRTVLRG
ncbi:hypothetical protein WMF20_06640 [Sorangium sp. So ce834]